MRNVRMNLYCETEEVIDMVIIYVVLVY
jgi:hypothetical protein